MTSSALKTLQDTPLNDNNSGQITPEDLRAVLTELIKKSGGWADYNNSNLTAQNISSGVWTALTNNGLGIYTNETYLPYYSNSLFGNNEIDLNGLPLGTVLTIRFELTLGILSNNTDVLFRINAKDSDGVSVYTSLFDYRAFKSTGTLTGVNFYEMYVGANILNGSIALEVYSDHNITSLWSGAFITIP